jgi:hypothetical protein
MQPLLQDECMGPFPHLNSVRFAYIWPLSTCQCWCPCVHVLHLDVVLSGRTWREPHITYGMIRSLIQLYIGYGIQVLNAGNGHVGKFLPLLTSYPLSFFHAWREEFSPFSFVGPGTTNCVRYPQNFILSDFSSSHRRVFSDV